MRRVSSVTAHLRSQDCCLILIFSALIVERLIGQFHESLLMDSVKLFVMRRRVRKFGS